MEPAAHGQNPFVVGGIGSCRIHTPLAKAEEKGLIRLVLHRAFGYVHNPYEILQLINLSTGEAAPPEELCAAMSIVQSKKLGPTSFDQFFGNVDAFVMEPSSIRVQRSGPHYFQIHRFREFLESFGNKLGTAEFFDNREKVVSVISALTADMEAGWLRDMLRRLESWEMSPEELYIALNGIVETTTKPIVFISQVTTGRGVKPIPQRALLLEVLTEVVERHDRALLIDPTQWVQERGVDRVMKDSAHYMEEYEPEVGDFLASQINAHIERVTRTPLRREALSAASA